MLEQTILSVSMGAGRFAAGILGSALLILAVVVGSLRFGPRVVGYLNKTRQSDWEKYSGMRNGAEIPIKPPRGGTGESGHTERVCAFCGGRDYASRSCPSCGATEKRWRV